MTGKHYEKEAGEGLFFFQDGIIMNWSGLEMDGSLEMEHFFHI